ncbi:iron sulfur protein [Nocardia sp. MH4]|uniref:Rieske (2Fe-2S) protein n=1 Tax=Nocardia TaxID=1817 RepID=UPI001C4E6C9A|nr:Rieske (2Fe-2S) protein [Nocardia sp. MH4]MBW0274443.1 iron sulfur protein [Nocardia sp. MH4]
MSTEPTTAITRRTAIAGCCTVCAIVATGCATGRADQKRQPARIPASRVEVGGATAFPEHRIVVTQPSAGVYRAYSAICTHQGCSVTDIAGDVMKCPCHGSTFKLADGSVAKGPAREPLAELTVTVQGDTLTVQ